MQEQKLRDLGFGYRAKYIIAASKEVQQHNRSVPNGEWLISLRQGISYPKPHSDAIRNLLAMLHFCFTQCLPNPPIFVPLWAPDSQTPKENNPCRSRPLAPLISFRRISSCFIKNFMLHLFLILLIYNVFTDFPCRLQGVADPRICTTHPYLLPNP